ncbi:MAG: hypothetical protein J5641_05040 [Bacteroidales bacterium]|nr:hypothetical protein [Bacteroidales bacterium]
MDNRSLEDRIAAALCDVLDEPEAYGGCVLGINKKTLEVAIDDPKTLGKDFDTYAINNFMTNNEDGDVDLDLSEISYVASRFE